MAARAATLFSEHSNQDQTDRPEKRTEPASPDVLAAASSPSSTEDEQQERQRRQHGLALGAPLTAVLIGGALVIENLTNAAELGADEADADVLATEGSQMASLADGEGAGAGQAARNGSQDGAAAAASSGAIQDLAPAAALEGDEHLSGDPAALASVDQASSSDGGHELESGDAATVGGMEIGLNFVSVDFNESEAGAEEPEAFVEEETIARKTIIGSPGDDILEGTDGHDTIIGGDGDDIIFGHGGNDLLYGNEGDDELHGGAGRDQLFGGAGNDFLEGGDDHDLDLLYGGIGDDVLIVNGTGDLALERSNNRGEDLQIVRDGYAAEKGTSATGTTFVFADNVGKALPTGAAADTQSMSTGIENLALEGNVDYDIFADEYNNKLYGNHGDNLIFAGGGDDVVQGGAGRDYLMGGRGRDDLSGGEGADFLEGGDHDDVLRGGDGDDILYGGSGQDFLYGEAGNDSYHVGLNDIAFDSIFDHEGANRVVLEGVTGETIEASLLGSDLYITADRTPVAKITDYVGNENSIAGVDFGQGLRSVDQLLVSNADLGSTVSAIEASRAAALANDPLRVHDDLLAPTKIGTNAADGGIRGTADDDWLSGLKGKDDLYGLEGNDILEGGGGNDLLRGGAGDDQYLFRPGEAGMSTIDDLEGQNYAKVEGFGRHKPVAEIVNGDLKVSVNNDAVFKVENYVGNEHNFIGVQTDDRFFETDELFA